MLIFLWIGCLSLALAQHPCAPLQCVRTCNGDDGSATCDAVCSPICEAPRCIRHNSPQSHVNCEIRCEMPTNSTCFATECPQCSTHCQTPFPDAQISCQMLVCAWQCRAPVECRSSSSSCNTTCETPACTLGSTSYDQDATDDSEFQSTEEDEDLAEQALDMATSSTTTTRAQAVPPQPSAWSAIIPAVLMLVFGVILHAVRAIV